jgi:hypothetical protein
MSAKEDEPVEVEEQGQKGEEEQVDQEASPIAEDSQAKRDGRVESHRRGRESE